MPKLPPKEYLTLQEVLQFMVDRGFSEDESKPALIDAFSSRGPRIEILGRSGSDQPRSVIRYGDWDRAVPDWDKNVIVKPNLPFGGRDHITEIGVRRIDLERWLGTAIGADAAPNDSRTAGQKLEDLWQDCLADGTVVGDRLTRHATRTKLREELAQKAGCELSYATKILKDRMNEVLGEELPGKKTTKISTR